MSRVSARDRRALRLGGWFSALALFGVLVAAPYVRVLGAERDQLASERSLLAREKGLLVRAGAIGAARESAANDLEERSSRLFSGVPALAAGALARYVADAAEGNRVVIESSRPRPVEVEAGGVLALRVDVRAEGDFEGILKLVHRLETGPRLVRVERLRLERENLRRLPGTQDDVQVISLWVSIVGYGLAPELTDSMAGSVR